ncbi:MAG TPA: GNAT family N-acetyltransferase [Acidimicrobiaceae bacterium]|nr:GNAT family N-acetyltransferase [Acidimicrobiaceae bacterium]
MTATSAAGGPARTVRTTGGVDLEIGTLRPEERDALYRLFAEIVERGEGFPQRPPLAEADFELYWGSGAQFVVVARHRGTVVGAYHVKPNFPGRAGHIANAGYVVDGALRGKGVGRALVEDSMVQARRAGFDAMQFNLVFASNPARTLYEELGFQVVGRVPAAVEGEDALVYWRALGP